ncbi:unnamed protein product [Medioppia subpectinata]|uniref:ABC transporter domain-containing protein n=1 Tax=Medioppia subpectinata TaxID=1979941 RepID=A0A7R9KSI2_9ACAR|nr:unnamed protein product [Medioppia subpectinata]CAG2107830.1 unnamed protein product [Medioppia subpectinata]
MAPLVIKQLGALLWKSWIVRRKHWISGLFELLLPIILGAAIAGNYVNSNSLDKNSSSGSGGGGTGWQKPTYYEPSEPYNMSNLFHSKYRTLSVYYSPNTSEVANKIMSKFVYRYNVTEERDRATIDKFGSFATEAELEHHLYVSSSSWGIGLVFMDTGSDHNALKLKIRPTGYSGMIDLVNRKHPETDNGPSQYSNGKEYEREFSQVQVAVYELYADYLANRADDDEQSTTGVTGGMNWLEMLGMVVITSYIIMCPLIVKRICDEKAAKAKEMLKMMVFNRPVIGVVVSVVLFEISHAVPMGVLSTMYNPNMDVEGTTGWRILTCFLPNSGMQWYFSALGQWELKGQGLTWDNIWSDAPTLGHFSGGLILLLQLMSILFYGLLIWYVDNVWPWQFGIPKPVYYPFLPSYWFPKQGKNQEIYSSKNDENKNAKHFEREPLNTRVGIKCEKLHKMFGNKTAVGDMSLNIYGGQITVLLGHNGAGKTTTMNMITGIFPPTSGTAYISGYDIRQQTRSARKSLGLCPQENILYSELDVSQHLKLYAILKGYPWADVNNEVQKITALVDLTDKANTMSTDLSGGMKRKLSLGIAMIGNTEIHYDLLGWRPYLGLRASVYTLQNENIRSERTILLTTHYMEEADALADRIAIMSEGEVKCCGSPMFLKKAFGAGYHLRIAKNREFNSQSVLNIIRKTMPNADIKSEINSEIIYSLEDSDERERIDTQSQTNGQLIQLFTHLESRKHELNIETYGLTVTTMEDVFLRVGNEYMDTSSVEEISKASTNSLQDADLLSHNICRNTGSKLRAQQFWALFLKRFHYAKRYWPMIILQTILPAILFMCILLLDQSLKKTTTNQSATNNLELSLKMYGPTQGFMQSSSAAFKQFTDTYIEVSKTQDMTTTEIIENPNNWTLSGNRGDDIDKYINTYLVGAQINDTTDDTTNTGEPTLILKPWYNQEAIHSLPVSINFLYETLLKQKFNDKKPSITLYNHPILYDQSSNTMFMVQMTMLVTCLLLVPLTVPFIGASYALFPIHERITQSKLLQLMNGISVHTFWAASYLFDIINHLLASIILFIVFAIFDFDKIFMGNGKNTP